MRRNGIPKLQEIFIKAQASKHVILTKSLENFIKGAAVISVMIGNYFFLHKIFFERKKPT